MSLPSLRNLQVFEAAARHQSFRAAADALFLTHGAVSRQVRALEAELGVALFLRTGQRVVLTEQGKRLQAAVAAGLRLMTDATADLRRHAARPAARLTVTLLPSFATRWLMARLPRFHEQHPEIAVEVIATVSLLDLAAEHIQLGIRYGEGRWAGVVAEKLATERLFPVAAPGGILRRKRLPRSARELLDYPLLNPEEGWDRWFRRAGVIGTPSHPGPTYSDGALLLQAAEAGQGVALGRELLVADALAAGTLTRLPGPAPQSRRAYYLIYPVHQALTPAAQAFAAWLREAMRATPHSDT